MGLKTNHCGRLWPSIVLGLLAGAGAAYDVAGAWARRAGIERPETAAPGSAALTIPDAGAGPEAWKRYGDGLRLGGRYADASRAYAVALKGDPVNRDLQFLRALMLVRSGDREAIYTHMTDLALTDPQLVYDVLDRQESKRLLGEERFRKLYEETRAQYID